MLSVNIVNQTILNVKEGKQVRDIEIELQKKDGNIIKNMAIAKSNIIDGKNRIIAILKKSELESSDLRFRNLIDLAPNGIITANIKGTILSINKAWTKLTGYTEEDFTSGRIKWNQLFHPEDASKTQEREIEYNKSPTPQLEYRIKAKDGTTHWILSKTQKFYNEIRKQWGARGIFIDITDKKISEQRLKELAGWNYVR